MKNSILPYIILFLGLFNMIMAFFFIPTEGYKEGMKYIKWGIFIFGFLFMCYGFIMLLKKDRMK